jgi:uncharacterized damage-inducible protein DinB
MNQLLRDLYLHQTWADAEHWRAFETYPDALIDETIRKRLHHIHLVQHAYLWIVEGTRTPFKRTSPADFKTPLELKQYAQEYHARITTILEQIGDARLRESVTIPWFKEPTLSVTVEYALTQASLHSQYHRGQNATRLRELGGNPPLTDFIAWLWKSRPLPQW